MFFIVVILAKSLLCTLTAHFIFIGIICSACYTDCCNSKVVLSVLKKHP